MILLAPVSVEEMMAPRSQQRRVWTGTERLIWLTCVWLTQPQAVSGEGKYRQWIRRDPNDVRVQIKVRLMPKVGSLRTEDAAQEEKVARTSCLIENWRQDLSLLNEGVTKNESMSGMIFRFCSADLLFTTIQTDFYRSTFIQSISFTRTECMYLSNTTLLDGRDM